VDPRRGHTHGSGDRPGRRHHHRHLLLDLPRDAAVGDAQEPRAGHQEAGRPGSGPTREARGGRMRDKSRMSDATTTDPRDAPATPLWVPLKNREPATKRKAAGVAARREKLAAAA